VNQDLQSALIETDLERAAELLRAGVDINARDQNGDSVLEDVISFVDDVAERRTVVTFMLDHGADPRLVAPDGAGPLFAAVIAQDREVLRLLLDHGADPNRENEGSETLYDWAEFDYRYETYEMKLPEEPKDEDNKSEEAWLQFLDRLAIKYNKRRPDYLFLLRERGALTSAEQQHFHAGENL